MILRASALAGLVCSSLATGACQGARSIDVGTVAGKSFSAPEQISATTAGSQAVLQLDSLPGACGALGAGQKLKSGQRMTITLSQGGAPVAPGVFTVVAAASGTGPIATVLYEEADAACTIVAEVHGLHGTVTLGSADASGFSGSADVTLDTADHVAFSFATSPCSALGSATGPTTCP
jgi:hypothetical protein